MEKGRTHGGMARLCSLLLALLLCAGVFAGCGQDATGDAVPAGDRDAVAEGGAQDPAPGNGEVRKIVNWTWSSGQFDLARDTYLETHPDANVEFEDVIIDANDYLTKLQQGYASGGDMPDMLVGEISWRASSFQLDIWENLEQEPYNFDRSLVFDYVVGTTSNDKGEIVGLENAQNPAVMAYKRDLALEYLGTENPDELSAMFQTYDDYISVGSRVYEESGGAVTLFSGLQDVSTMMQMQQRDQRNLNADGDLEVSGKIAPITQVLEQCREANVCGNLTQWSTQWYAAFGQSNNIFFPCAAWSVTYQIEPNDPDGIGNWGMLTPAEGGYGWGGSCYGIYKNSQVKEEVWDFISWLLLTAEGAEVMKEGSSFFLPVKSLYDDPSYTEGTRPHFGDQEIYKFMMEDIASVIPSASLTVYDQLVNDSLDMIAQLMTADESVTAEAALEMFLEDLQAKVPDVTVK